MSACSNMRLPQQSTGKEHDFTLIFCWGRLRTHIQFYVYINIKHISCAFVAITREDRAPRQQDSRGAKNRTGADTLSPPLQVDPQRSSPG